MEMATEVAGSRTDLMHDPLRSSNRNDVFPRDGEMAWSADVAPASGVASRQTVRRIDPQAGGIRSHPHLEHRTLLFRVTARSSGTRTWVGRESMPSGRIGAGATLGLDGSSVAYCKGKFFRFSCPV